MGGGGEGVKVGVTVFMTVGGIGDRPGSGDEIDVAVGTMTFVGVGTAVDPAVGVAEGGVSGEVGSSLCVGSGLSVS